MSNTKRNDSRKQEGKRAKTMFMGEMYTDDTPNWEFTSDKHNRRGHADVPKWFKQKEERKRRLRRNKEIKNLTVGKIEPEEVGSPREPKENLWNWT